MISRLARLWSVVIPALILTYFADRIGMAFDGSLYPDWFPRIQHPFGRLAMSGVVLNQIWFFDVRPLSDSPFWSLCYEWWYYVAFGCFVLLPNWKGKVFSVGALLIAGPKIWLLFPVWLIGVAIHRMNSRMSKWLASFLFVLPLGIFAALISGQRPYAV